MICSSFVFGFWKGLEWGEEEVNLVHYCFFFEGGVWKVRRCMMYCLVDDVPDYFI